MEDLQIKINNILKTGLSAYINNVDKLIINIDKCINEYNMLDDDWLQFPIPFNICKRKIHKLIKYIIACKNILINYKIIKINMNDVFNQNNKHFDPYKMFWNYVRNCYINVI